MPILSLDDAELFYETHGEGPPMIFCSATATHGDVWKFHQVPEFSRDHTVITFDQRGTGQSRARSKDYSNKRLAGDAAALLEHLGAKSAVTIGHSNGGRVAQRLAVERPDLVGRLVLLSSGGASKSQGIPLDMCMEMVELGYEPWVRDQAIRLGFSKAWVATHPAELERFLDVRLAAPPSLEVYLRHVIGRQAFDLGARIAEIAAPTLVMVGDDEDHGPPGHVTHFAYARMLSEEIPRARLVVLPGQGHYYYYSDPAATHRAIRAFLAET
jgi:pimeloyl-ACP methyl ester carboxylesterase